MLLARLKAWAGRLKRDVVALWLAARDARTPWAARMVAIGVAAYALSPIDLIPDFLPVIGYLDDLVLVPLGIALAVSLIPPDLMVEFRHTAKERARRPESRAGAFAIVVGWVAFAALIGWWAVDQVAGQT